MATFLLRLLEASGVEVSEVAAGRPFLDVRAADDHAGSIAALADLGLVRGTGGGLFRPEAPVTRAQTMTFLVVAYELATGAQLPEPATEVGTAQVCTPVTTAHPVCCILI